ncbi:unnamed protein product [Onchocerca flexuosa]|uniref:Uncharacterized protein n=1 Tax=Onchocerca flexuosa TaxID=387005 RepID=A0A183HXP0_9BILA|nr:unnamed protein product [Onchocerca flexuosa]
MELRIQKGMELRQRNVSRDVNGARNGAEKDMMKDFKVDLIDKVFFLPSFHTVFFYHFNVTCQNYHKSYQSVEFSQLFYVEI